MAEYYEKYGVLLEPSKDWEKPVYGFEPEGMGDCISNTMRYSIDNKITKFFLTCKLLLIGRRRWPSKLDNHFLAKTRLGNKVTWFLLKRGLRKSAKYRPRQDMTRDPYIYYWAACVILKSRFYKEYLALTTAPWYLYSPTVWSWRKYLINGKGGFLYKLSIGFNFQKRDYVERMADYMKLAFDKVRDE